MAAILETPVTAFLPDVAPVIIDPDPHGRPIRYGAYLVEGRIVWGATAAILGQFGAVLGRGEGRARAAMRAGASTGPDRACTHLAGTSACMW